jgi:hypothetical protein
LHVSAAVASDGSTSKLGGSQSACVVCFLQLLFDFLIHPTDAAFVLR